MREALRHELRELAARFDVELADLSLGLADMLGQQLPSVIGELRAVAAHAESATGVILDACEALEVACAGGEAACTQIYEACLFQDIVGQRLVKALSLLGAMETRAAGMLDALGPPEPAAPWEAPLASGPQLRLVAMNQHSVDAVMAAGA